MAEKSSAAATATRGAPSSNGTVDQNQLLAALRAFENGDFTVRLPLDWTGMAGDVAAAFNNAVQLNERMLQEFQRVSTAVGRDGRIQQRASLGGVPGSWSRCIDAVNLLIGDLTQPAAEISRVLASV
ncbi:MAG: hypothetical protein KGJ86_13535, partial [Chloroflexota bacterium]|nr:hypothetical protein [Chloroflexota bacterium]